VGFRKCFDLQEILSQNYLNSFKAAAEGNSVEKYDADTVKVFKQLGINTEFLQEVDKTRRDVIEVINDPNCTDIKLRVQRYIDSIYAFFRSQHGFETYPESKELRKNIENSDFFNLTDRLMNSIRMIPENLQSIKFDDNTADEFAQAVFLLSRVVASC
jgi:hypothetical protein